MLAVRWEERLRDLFADLEQQAEGLAHAERDAEVADQARAEYVAVDLAARLHGSTGARIRLEVGGVGAVVGVLRRVGDGWCLVESDGVEWIVRTAAVSALRGLLDRAVAAQARPVTARLGLASALRGASEARSEVQVCRLDGAQARGLLGRVGADFVEVSVQEDQCGHLETVPFTALAAVRAGWSRHPGAGPVGYR